MSPRRGRATGRARPRAPRRRRSGQAVVCVAPPGPGKGRWASTDTRVRSSSGHRARQRRRGRARAPRARPGRARRRARVRRARRATRPGALTPDVRPLARAVRRRDPGRRDRDGRRGRWAARGARRARPPPGGIGPSGHGSKSDWRSWSSRARVTPRAGRAPALAERPSRPALSTPQGDLAASADGLRGGSTMEHVRGGAAVVDAAVSGRRGGGSSCERRNPSRGLSASGGRGSGGSAARLLSGNHARSGCIGVRPRARVDRASCVHVRQRSSAPAFLVRE